MFFLSLSACGGPRICSVRWALGEAIICFNPCVCGCRRIGFESAKVRYRMVGLNGCLIQPEVRYAHWKLAEHGKQYTTHPSMIYSCSLWVRPWTLLLHPQIWTTSHDFLGNPTLRPYGLSLVSASTHEMSLVDLLWLWRLWRPSKGSRGGGV